jgi:hypothetical protein
MNRRADQIISASESELRSPAARRARQVAVGAHDRPIAAHRNDSLDTLRGRQHRRTRRSAAIRGLNAIDLASTFNVATG